MEEKTIGLLDYAETYWSNKISSLYDIAQDVYNKLCKSKPQFLIEEGKMVMFLAASYDSDFIFSCVVKHLLIEMLSADYDKLGSGEVIMDFGVHHGVINVKFISQLENPPQHISECYCSK